VLLLIWFCRNSIFGDARGEWPPIAPGKWKLDVTRLLPDGKKQEWHRTANQCSRTDWLFRTYYGLGVVEKSGCRFRAAKLSENSFEVTSECDIRGIGLAKSTSRVSLNGPKQFVVEVQVMEGQHQYRVTETGKQVGDCRNHP
jgi:hypothetical protein